MKKIILVILLLIFLVGCTKEYNLENQIEKINELDEKYDAHWREEKLLGKIVSQDKIHDYIDEISVIEKEVKDELMKDYNDNTKQAHLFVEARKEMLLSYDAYYYATGIGKEFFVGEYGGVNCEDEKKIRKVAQKLNESVNHMIKAIDNLDLLQQNWPETTTYIGVNDYKPELYNTEGWKIKKQVRLNMNVVDEVMPQSC